MPKYTYTCARCGATYDRIVGTWRERDTQLCDRLVNQNGHSHEPVTCQGVLDRKEVEVTSFTPYAWKP